jgi:hypothetical protein
MGGGENFPFSPPIRPIEGFSEVNPVETKEPGGGNFTFSLLRRLMEGRSTN